MVSMPCDFDEFMIYENRNKPAAKHGSRDLSWLLLLCILLCWTAADAKAQVFDPAKVGPPLSNAPAELYLPAGGAPTGAVVVLHGCNGVGPHYREWARRLAGWGFAALLIDSFGPRGFKEVCNRGRLVPPEAQARDGFDGAAFLRAEPEVRAARVGVIGFSHGAAGRC